MLTIDIVFLGKRITKRMKGTYSKENDLSNKMYSLFTPYRGLTMKNENCLVGGGRKTKFFGWQVSCWQAGTFVGRNCNIFVNVKSEHCHAKRPLLAE